MLSATSNLFVDLLGRVFPVWLTCEPVMYVCGALILGLLIKVIHSITQL